MNILLTGATGYIGKRLLPLLVEQGHYVICCVRDKDRFFLPDHFKKQVKVIEVDFLNQESLIAIPNEIDDSFDVW
jgi:uncharacterized protein YbjT (DUF2867 family)